MTQQFEDYLANSLTKGYANHSLKYREQNGRIECEIGPEGEKPELVFTSLGCVIRIRTEDTSDEPG